MINTTQKSTLVRQDPLIHITNTSPQIIHDNHTDNTTYIIIITHNQKRHHDTTVHVTITHPITVIHSHHTATITLTHNHTHRHSHTITPASFLFQQLQLPSRSILPPRALCIALTLDTPVRFSPTLQHAQMLGGGSVTCRKHTNAHPARSFWEAG